MSASVSFSLDCSKSHGGEILVYCAGQWGLSVRFIHITFSCHHIDRHSMSDIRTSTIHTNHIPWPTAHSLSLTHSLCIVCIYTGDIFISPLPSQPSLSTPLKEINHLYIPIPIFIPPSRYPPSQRSKTSHTHPSILPSLLTIHSRAQFFFLKKKDPRSKSPNI